MFQTKGTCYHDPKYKPFTHPEKKDIPVIPEAVLRSQQFIRENKQRWEKEDNGR